MLEGIELSAIHEENARQLIRRLLNLIEKLSADLRDLQAENQVLRDENNHLKGEQGKPKAKANKPMPVEVSQHSSEKERKKKRVRHKAGKKAEIKIDREEVVKVKQEELPSDAIQRFGRNGSARHPAEDQQCALLEREILFCLEKENLPGKIAARIRRAVWAGRESAHSCVLFWNGSQ
jgi:hypothetical protein